MPEILPLSSKPIAWIGAAYDELMDLPVAVRRLHREVCGYRLCPALLPEEINKGNRDAQADHRAD